jgi:hypothetical protein
MTAGKPASARETSRPRPARETRTEVLPPMPDKQLWKADKAGGFEAGVQWFLAVSRNA